MTIVSRLMPAGSTIVSYFADEITLEVERRDDLVIEAGTARTSTAASRRACCSRRATGRCACRASVATRPPRAVRSAPITSSPVSRATPSSTPRAAADAGTTHVPGASFFSPDRTRAAAVRNTGTPAFCRRAAAMKPAFDSGPNDVGPLRRRRKRRLRAASSVRHPRERRLERLRHRLARRRRACSRACDRSTSYGGFGGPPGNSRRSGYSCFSSIVFANAPYGCASLITYEPAAYDLPSAVNAAFA